MQRLHLCGRWDWTGGRRCPPGGSLLRLLLLPVRDAPLGGLSVFPLPLLLNLPSLLSYASPITWASRLRYPVCPCFLPCLPALSAHRCHRDFTNPDASLPSALPTLLPLREGLSPQLGSPVTCLPCLCSPSISSEPVGPDTAGKTAKT